MENRPEGVFQTGYFLIGGVYGERATEGFTLKEILFSLLFVVKFFLKKINK